MLCFRKHKGRNYYSKKRKNIFHFVCQNLIKIINWTDLGKRAKVVSHVKRVFTLTIFSGLDLHLFHNRSLVTILEQRAVFFYLLSHLNFLNITFSTYLSCVHSHIESSHICTYTYIHPHILSAILRDHTHVLSFAWVLVRRMKRDGVAEEGKERTKREGSVQFAGLGFRFGSLTPPHPPSPSLHCCCCCCCYHPPYAAWRWSTTWGMVVDQYCSGSRGMHERPWHAHTPRQAGVDLRTRIPLRQFILATLSATLLIFSFLNYIAIINTAIKLLKNII